MEHAPLEVKRCLPPLAPLAQFFFFADALRVAGVGAAGTSGFAPKGFATPKRERSGTVTLKAMAVKRAQLGSARKVSLSISIESVLTRVSHRMVEPMAPEQMRLARRG